MSPINRAGGALLLCAAIWAACVWLYNLWSAM